jgi:glycosyltransferase involved in cell wall biosynthesis
MKIVLFTHPEFLGSQSMPRFAAMLSEGMKALGHEVEVLSPQAKLFKLPFPASLKKWLGYMDQYILFPAQVKKKLKSYSKDTLFVFADQALGPWIPLVANRPHVIHCHDFLAQRSALGQIPENVTSASGQKYQTYIRNGYSKGRNFISVSEKTKSDLEQLLGNKPSLSEVVYNGLNPSFKPLLVDDSRTALGLEFKLDLTEGYLLHVGGNQWYKNRVGLISIYNKWRERYGIRLPLLLIGQQPNAALQAQYQQSRYKNDIHFFSGINDATVRMAYSGASVFIFPSIAEGFGWPIAEAMASGTPVITTNEAPMLEVAGEAAMLIKRRPSANSEQDRWATEAAAVLQKAAVLTEPERQEWMRKGMENISRFKLDNAIERIEQIYKQVLKDN